MFSTVLNIVIEKNINSYLIFVQSTIYTNIYAHKSTILFRNSHLDAWFDGSACQWGWQWHTFAGKMECAAACRPCWRPWYRSVRPKGVIRTSEILWSCCTFGHLAHHRPNRRSPIPYCVFLPWWIPMRYKIASPESGRRHCWCPSKYRRHKIQSTWWLTTTVASVPPLYGVILSISNEL